ncbi:MAG: RsmE family RNA methyltransferase [Acidobacteriota bacterium]
MNLRRFFSLCELKNDLIEISGEDLYHLKKVMRGKPGDPLEVINGTGSLFRGNIIEINNSRAVIRVKEKYFEPEPEPGIIIAPSIIKNRPMRFMIEKLTELGVDEIRPLYFNRTDVKYSSGSVAKWEKIAIESLKVNNRLWKTKIFEPVSIQDIIESSVNIKSKILLDIEGKKETFNFNSPPVLCIIGPPGDFTPEERELFRKNGFNPVNINSSILKVETAAISAGSILKLFLN